MSEHPTAAPACAHCGDVLHGDTREAVRCFSCGPSRRLTVCEACALRLDGWVADCDRCLPSDPALQPNFQPPIAAVAWDGAGFEVADRP